MPVRKALRAWLGSAVTCALLMLSLWGWGRHSVRTVAYPPGTSMEMVQSVVNGVPILLGLCFGIAAALVYVPTFIMLEKFLRSSLGRFRAILVAVSLAPVPTLLLTLTELTSIRSWSPWSMIPFVVPCAVFGWLWVGARKKPNPAGDPAFSGS